MADQLISGITPSTPQSTDQWPAVRGTTPITLSTAGVSALSLPIGGGTLTGLEIHKPPVGSGFTFRQLDDTNQDANSRKWNENISTWVNTGGGNNNNTWNFGYNNGIGGGRVDATDAAFYLQLESNYNPTAGAHAPVFEYHLNQYSAGAGAGFRPFQWTVARNGSWSDVTYMTDQMTFLTRAGAQNMVIQNGVIYLYGAALVQISNNVDFMKQYNAAQSALISLLHVRSDDAIEIGNAAASKVVTSRPLEAHGDFLHTGTNIGFFSHAAAAQPTKAGHNNWAAISDVVAALVAIGIFDAA